MSNVLLANGVLTQPVPIKLFSAILQKALLRSAAEVEQSHTASQQRIVMARPTKQPLPNVTSTLNESYPVLFHNRRKAQAE